MVKSRRLKHLCKVVLNLDILLDLCPYKVLLTLCQQIYPIEHLVSIGGVE